MNEQDKVIIDENLDSTFATLNGAPNIFRVKDYATNLPADYADDFAYALFEACLTRDAKFTLTKLVLGNCEDKNAGTNIENERFNELYKAAKEANPNCRNGYIPMFFAYIQLVAEDPGITNEENDKLVAKFLNIINENKGGLFPSKLYRQDEYDNSIGLENPVPAQSFLAQLKDFYTNLMTNPISTNLFDAQIINSTLNQYIDDIYSLTYNDEDNSMAWFERTDRILEIVKSDAEDKRDELVSNSHITDTKKLYKDIIKGLVGYPLYKDGKYDFSYFSTAANLLAENLNVFLFAYNNVNKDNQLQLPETALTSANNKECLESYQTFIASYMTALISKNYDLENEENDPERLLDPNLKVNLLKANENIFELSASEGRPVEETTVKVRQLINIATELVNFAENEQSLATNMATERNTVNPVANNTISSNEVIKYLLKYLAREEKVFAEVIKNLYTIEDHMDNNRVYKKDKARFAEYKNKYAPNEVIFESTIRTLIDIVDRKADKFVISVNALKNRSVIQKIASTFVIYNTPNVPDVIKKKEVIELDQYITKVLNANRCGQKDNVDKFISIFHEMLEKMPTIKQDMDHAITAQTFTCLKTQEPCKKAMAFSSVIAKTLYLDQANNSTTYRFVESIFPTKSLRLEQKFVAKDYAIDAINDVIANLKGNTLVKQEIIDELTALADRLDENKPGSYIVNGFISKEDKREAIRTVKNIFKQIPNKVLTSKENSMAVNLNDLIPGLIKKIPTPNAVVVKNEETVAAMATKKPDEKKMFESNLRKIIADLDKDERTKYLTYFKRLFAPAARNFQANDDNEKAQIEKYLVEIKHELEKLIKLNKNNPALVLTADEMQEILDKYAVTEINIDNENPIE